MTPPSPRQIRQLRTKVKEIVDASDPMVLLQQGAPSNEYDNEVHAILMEYLRIGPDPEALTWTIQNVFDRMFSCASVPLARSKYMAARLCELGSFNGSDQTSERS